MSVPISKLVKSGYTLDEIGEENIVVYRWAWQAGYTRKKEPDRNIYIARNGTLFFLERSLQSSRYCKRMYFKLKNGGNLIHADTGLYQGDQHACEQSK